MVSYLGNQGYYNGYYDGYYDGYNDGYYDGYYDDYYDGYYDGYHNRPWLPRLRNRLLFGIKNMPWFQNKFMKNYIPWPATIRTKNEIMMLVDFIAVK